MNKFSRGSIVKTATGAVQFVRNNHSKKDFILVTSRQGDLYIPVSAIEKALEDQWVVDEQARARRYKDV